MKFIKTVVLRFCIAAPLFAAGSAFAADKPQCGLNNGKVATGQPIEIGSVVGKTGPADFSASGRAAEAYFKCVNANGGINGRPVHYTMLDDAWNPEQAGQVAAKLVRDQKVMALVGNSSFMDCAVNEKLYEAEGVVVIAGVGVPRDCFHSKNIAPVNEGPRLSNLGGLIYVQQTFGSKRVAVVGTNIPGVGDWACGGMKEWGKAHAVDVTCFPVDPGSVDATATMLQVVASNPDTIVIDQTKEAAVQLYAAAEAQDLGSKYHFVGPTSQYNEGFPKAIGSYWDGKAYVQLELEPLDKKSPDNLNWRAILDTYATPADQRDTFSQAGYLAARFTTEALLKLDPAKIDRTSVTEALRAIKQVKSDIMCGQWYFGPGDEHNANHRGSVSVVDKGAFVTKASCVEIEDPALANILAGEKAQHLVD